MKSNKLKHNFILKRETESTNHLRGRNNYYFAL